MTLTKRSVPFLHYPIQHRMLPEEEVDPDWQHVEAWSKMLAASDPPVKSTSISPYLDEHAFRSASALHRSFSWHPSFHQAGVLTRRNGHLLRWIQSNANTRFQAQVSQSRGRGTEGDREGVPG